ncbi:MAG: hypothetical protein V2A73_18825 [Pseudomonadota bacterium]
MRRHLRYSLAVLPLAVMGCGSLPSPRELDAAPSKPAWEVMVVPEVSYYGVSGSGKDDVVMVGEKGTIVHWDGDRLHLEESGSEATLRGVWVVSPELAFVVGAGGVALRWDGVRWNSETSGTTANLLAVWANEERAVAVGEGGNAVEFDGTAWKAVAVDCPDSMLALFLAGEQITAVGMRGTVARLGDTGFRCRAISTGYLGTLAGATTGPGGSYVVGLEGAVFEVSGGNYRRLANTGIPDTFLRGVAAPTSTPGGGSLFLAGWDGFLARWSSGEDGLIVYDDVPRRWFYGLYASSEDDVWAVGTSGLVLHGPPVKTIAVDGGLPVDSAGGD